VLDEEIHTAETFGSADAEVQAPPNATKKH
jgi:hypothetical protein